MAEPTPEEIQKIEDAIKEYGKDIVMQVTAAVNLADPDSVYAVYQDMEMDDHASCLAMLYFEG